jgi:16S rRNA (guanine966-N2)-methyltransferase
VICESAIAWLEAPANEPPFDIVFVDPPYDSELLAAAAAALSRRIAPDARIYLESRAREPLPALPSSWKELRAGRAGEVGYHLFSV